MIILFKRSLSWHRSYLKIRALQTTLPLKVDCEFNCVLIDVSTGIAGITKTSKLNVGIYKIICWGFYVIDQNTPAIALLWIFYSNF